MANKRILTWIRAYPGKPPPPSETPFGRAAMQLEKEGLTIWIAANPNSWMQADPDGWKPVSPAPVHAVYDRFSSRSLAESYSALNAQMPDCPRGNPADLIRICTDKVATQRALHNLPMPEIATNPSEFTDQLARWGQGYLKARFGGLGRGIRLVVPGDPLPAWGPGTVRGGSEPTFLQRAILPPKGFGSLCVRWLVQRTPGGNWQLLPPVARVSQEAVANVHQGAQALPAEDVLPQSALNKGAELVLSAAERLTQLSHGPALEFGVDLLFDGKFNPWLLEVNSRPSGRLSALTARQPKRFSQLAREAALRPLRSLAALA
jgi:glutathione synthase/RimK-type ligase-like ATP-grasp enzyme